MGIHIGELIERKLRERQFDKAALARKLNKSYPAITYMLQKPNIKTDELLQISKILKYDFFRLYTANILLTCPRATVHTRRKPENTEVSNLPSFKKTAYTPEFIDKIVEDILEGRMTRVDAMKKYRLPKTTLYRWCRRRNMQEQNLI